ncbi:MAG: ABC transporter permease [Chloroflexota bacterium]
MSKFIEGMRIAFGSIAINRTRAALTMLGIVIGVAAVISLISLGRGVETWVEDEFNSLGANMLIVAPAIPESEDRTRIETITTNDVETLLSPGVAPSIEDIAMQYNLPGFVNNGEESMRTSVRGVSANYDFIRNWNTVHGAFLTQQQVDEADKVAVIGTKVVLELYDEADYDPTGDVVKVNDQTFTIIGVMEDRDEPFNNDNGAVLVPITTAQTRLDNARTNDGLEISTFYARAWNAEVTGSAEEELDAYFYEDHDIAAEDQKDYAITNMGENFDILDQITATLTIFLGMIAGVSLLVGGIGIMNIMLVSVTERTQEIGLRKAVGAEPTDILLQFLLESASLSIAGGIVGILIGWGFTEAGTALVNALTLRMDLDAVMLAVVISAGVGIGAGMWPAWRAARMHPIDALRFD